ncbi:hypothetical protein FHX74_000911 [Friedmanniella endophytica]|uniref:Uncharacterized protein n=1 Tax=Microlunatus kandeliicorticis TaxID=1759536 RepID=A0A7W3P4Z3_9ACTN|nr:hypothetical protein [Microlunatus kandeliicorticis]MBA8793317.1 hypothetical protein [Microlunatus kandeliicorticis]
MDLILLLLVVAVIGGGGALLYGRHATRQREAAAQAELESQLTTSKKAADEDVTKFGEELQRLDTDVAGHPLDEAMQQDYQRALDAYDDAKMSLDAVRKPEEIRHVTEILEDGRYAIACVKARIAGDPLPQKRPPCFFNPAHGPSTQNVEWAPAGGTPRDVPACAADAERVLAGADPYIRTVQVGAQRVPYWQGGQAYAPWAQGYYSRWNGSDLLSGVLIGSFLFGGMGNIFGGIGEGLDGLGEGIGEGIGGIGEGIGDGLGDIGSGIGDMFDGIGDFFGGD